ncbi:MAG: hypothetical protein J6J43_08185 [Oscillospiraceae bacterium]|nr:hypothetical protein [Oscillospiraceae bacterium]
MKKLFVCLAALLLLAGCGMKDGVDLMPNADPETSALALYIYDGETITRQHLFETDAYRAQVMEDFHHADAREAAVDVTSLQPPFYGIEMGAGDLGSVKGLWSDGYFIARNGKTYAFDYDFAAFAQNHPWDTADEFHDLAVMPCADLVAKTAKGWNAIFLTPAQELVPPSGISLEANFDGDLVNVRFTNLSGEEWGYGYDYGLQVLLDGVWYNVPAEQEMAVVEVLCMLLAEDSAEETYSLAPYGYLPPGTYRFVTQGLAAEFER